MNTIQNKEHHEAAQASLNELAAKHRALLSDEELRKLEIIEKAVGELEKAGIIFYLYAYQPVFNNCQRVSHAMVQYNSIFKNAAIHDEVSGKLTDEGTKRVVVANDSFLNTVYAEFGGRNPFAPKELSPEQRFYWFVGKVLWPALIRESQRLGAAMQKKD